MFFYLTWLLVLGRFFLVSCIMGGLSLLLIILPYPCCISILASLPPVSGGHSIVGIAVLLGVAVPPQLVKV